MINPRLKKITEYINSEIVADIGCDHAYVPIELIKSERAKKVIATDVRQGPLDIAKNNILRYGFSDKIETRLGSGFDVLGYKEADIVIIAGMGGELICDIISANTEKARAALLLLQPMNAQYELRHFLIENGFSIEKEDLERAGGRIYNFLIVNDGEQAPFENEIFYHLPKELFSHPLFNMLVNKKEREFKKILNGLSKSKKCDLKKQAYYKKMIMELKNIERTIK